VKIAVVGGSAAGLFASLLLARTGHDVVVLDREPLKLARDVESAAEVAFRPTAPQIVQPHLLMAKCRDLLMRALPDVYDGMLAAGVAEAPISTHMPSSLSDTSARPGDELLTTIMSRRSTVDWVLLRTALAEPRVELRGAVRILGLLATPDQPPHVTGVRTDHGELQADIVVDATGRRSAIDSWLEEIGARPTATWRAECGLAYFSRHYRIRSGAKLPGPAANRVVQALDEFAIGKWGADNDAVQIAVVPLAADNRFRTVRHPEVYNAVVRTVPMFAKWLDGLDPITGIFPMAGLHNTLRRLVVDGIPVATGLHAIGDSVCTTNPTLGRGLALALWGAADLADVTASHDTDWTAQALMLDKLVGDHVVPYYEDQAAIDAARLEKLRHRVFGQPSPEPPAAGQDRVTYAELREAATVDPSAYRALWRVNGMMCLPDEVYLDPEVVACTRAALAWPGFSTAIAQPSREELLSALAA
jgi:2-polyprenyl-6-methoxyphenol hydroxylase-like FAD-dependent oxidoreductase